MPRLLILPASFLIFLASAFCQTQITGSRDYGLGGSSVMFLPRPSAVFLNSSQLARIHQGEMLIVAHRFSELPSLSAAYFIPHFGTLGLGAANEGTSSTYSVGFGRLLGRTMTAGAAVNFARADVDRITLSLGSSLHLFTTESVNTGLHVGASVLNLSARSRSSLLRANLGAAYWIAPNVLRAQAAWRYQAQTTDVLGGMLLRVSPWIALYAGTVSFKKAAGGVGFHSTYLNLDLAFGEPGVSFSVNFRFTDDSRDARDRYFDRGRRAYDDERYAEAHDEFSTSLQYDEYYSPAITMATLASAARDTALAVYFREGKANEGSGSYVAAIKMYSQVLKTDPNHKEARERMSVLETKFRSRVQELVTTGDSLRELRRYDRARSTYREVLDFDPDNPEAMARIANLDSVISERVQYHLTKARTHLAKDQVDDARREYEQVLLYEPKNGQAQNRLESLKARRTVSELFDRGKATFDQGNYFEALTIFLDVAQRDPANKDVKSYIDRARETLQREVDDQFKSGLQYYIKENYQVALEVWNRVLVIQPNHQATLEYSKRAREKIEALEKLK